MPFSLFKTIKPPKKSKKGDLPKTAEEWVGYINDMHDSGVQARRKWEFQWTLNHSYFLGYQHLTWNQSTQSIDVPRGMVKPLTINRIGSFTEARLAKLTKNRPIPRVMPNTTSPEDINGARNADHALKYLWMQTEMEEKYDDYVLLGLLHGTSFMRTTWDPFMGDFVEREVLDKDDQLEMTSDGSVKKEKIFMGEVMSKPISAFNMIPGNENIPNLKDQPWIIERCWFSVSDLEHFYPHLKDQIKKAALTDKTENEKIIDRLASPISASVGASQFRKEDTLNNEALAKIFWMRPNSQYEHGIVAVVIGDQLAHIDKFPNDYGTNCYPYSMFKERTDGIHFWGQATIERLMSIQRAYNRLRQKKLKNAYLMANGKWLLAKGSQVMEGALNDEEGEVIEYNSAVDEPHQAAIAPLPNYVVQLAEDLIRDFRDVGGQRESSVTPAANLTAGVAMQVAAELGDEIIGPILGRLSRATRIIANQQLILMNEEYIEERKVRIFDERNSLGNVWFSAVDFRHHTDVHIEVDSMFPDFKGAKQQRLFDMWDRQIISDPKMFLKAWRFGNIETVIEDLEMDAGIVQLEIKQIKDGREPEITPAQNHLEHFKILTNWIQSADFLRLIPERKQLGFAVLNAHMNILLEQQGAQQGARNPNAVATPAGQSVPPGRPGNTGPQS